ncbi:uncharacterized protein LOC104652532 [Saimiri boliviensis]|uniref:uncharacterized protein LOC104652532 n=1 Tax=Saimiri boliviensis TaxID=27679 RepID=UPI003D774630
MPEKLPDDRAAPENPLLGTTALRSPSLCGNVAALPSPGSLPGRLRPARPARRPRGAHHTPAAPGTARGRPLALGSGPSRRPRPSLSPRRPARGGPGEPPGERTRAGGAEQGRAGPAEGRAAPPRPARARPPPHLTACGSRAAPGRKPPRGGGSPARPSASSPRAPPAPGSSPGASTPRLWLIRKAAARLGGRWGRLKDNRAALAAARGFPSAGAGPGGRGGAGPGHSPPPRVPVGGRAGRSPPPRAGRRGKERPEPPGSLPWDTSCSALGPGRSPHLSGSLPRPPAEVCAGGDTRHPRPAPRRARPGLAAGPGALWVGRVAAPGLPAGPPGGGARGGGRGPEGRPGGSRLRRSRSCGAPGTRRPVGARNGRGWQLELGCGVQSGGRSGGTPPPKPGPPAPPPPTAAGRASGPDAHVRGPGIAAPRTGQPWGGRRGAAVRSLPFLLSPGEGRGVTATNTRDQQRAEESGRSLRRSRTRGSPLRKPKTQDSGTVSC